MSSARPRRFSRQVFRGVALLLLTVSTVFTGHFVYVQRGRMESALLDRGRGLGTLLATGAKIAVYSENAELVRETLQGVAERRDVLAAAVFTEGRALVAARGRTPAREAAVSALTPREFGVVQRLRAGGGCLTLETREVVEVFCPVEIRERGAPGSELFVEKPPESGAARYVGFARLALDRAPQRREIALLGLRSLALLAAVLLVGGWAAFRFARRVTEPLQRLTEAVRAFGAGGEPGDLPGMPNDEIGRLAEAFTAMTRDIAGRQREQERLAERLRHAQEMEAVGRLSQGVSHDFKNLLSTLKTAVHILEKGSPGNEFVLTYTARMQATLGRARELVERLVTFSRTRELSREPVDLAALLERLAPAFRDVLGERVRLEVEVGSRPVPVLGDAASLEQLLANLVYNARDAMPDGGVVRLRLDVAAGGAGEHRAARLEASDTGAGMASEVCERIFEPFFTTKDPGAGLGLGLSIVRGIVEEHGGRIAVESAPGAGTTFTVELPLADGAA